MLISRRTCIALVALLGAMAYSKSAYALWAYNGLQLPAPNNLPGFADGAGNYIGGGYNNFGAGFYKVDPTGAILWSTLNATQGTLMGAAPDRAGAPSR